MNNLFSYCGLTDARMRASEKDLPVGILAAVMKKNNAQPGKSNRGWKGRLQIFFQRHISKPKLSHLWYALYQRWPIFALSEGR